MLAGSADTKCGFLEVPSSKFSLVSGYRGVFHGFVYFPLFPRCLVRERERVIREGCGKCVEKWNLEPSRRYAVNWIILRCSGKSTVALVRSLEAAGYLGQVWTPTIEAAVRTGSNRSKSKVDVAVLPSYAFCDADRVDDLIKESADPTSNHPKFSIFRHNGRIAVVPDRSLDGLRVERNKKSDAKHIQLPFGERVRTMQSGFEGLTGCVVGGSGKWTFVEFEGFALPVKISTFLLIKEEA